MMARLPHLYRAWIAEWHNVRRAGRPCRSGVASSCRSWAFPGRGRRSRRCAAMF